MSLREAVPRVSIVTPTFNRAEFLEETIRSVLEQDYPNIEYIVMDGGSTDGSVEIIRRYAGRLAYWESAPDRGQVDAIQRGFARSTGTVLAYLNSDDAYVPGAVSGIVRTFRERPSADLVFGDVHLVDTAGRRLRDLRFTAFDFDTLLYEGGNLSQPGAFWTRDLYDRVGGIDPAYQFSLDTDFFFRAARVGRFEHVRSFIANFRIHSGSKSATIWDVGVAECDRIRARYLPRRATAFRIRIGLVICRLRRLARYVAQGDLPYVLGGVARRLGR